MENEKLVTEVGLVICRHLHWNPKLAEIDDITLRPLVKLIIAMVRKSPKEEAKEE